MDSRQRRIQELLRQLADRSRFRMLCELATGPTHVSDLAARVGLSQSCATRHVQALVAAGAVECRRAGKRVMVAARDDDEVVRTLLAWVRQPARLPDDAPRAAEHQAGGRPPGRRATIRTEKLPPASAPDSGTPPPATEAPEPTPAARSRTLEDFLL